MIEADLQAQEGALAERQGELARYLASLAELEMVGAQMESNSAETARIVETIDALERELQQHHARIVALEADKAAAIAQLAEQDARLRRRETAQRIETLTKQRARAQAAHTVIETTTRALDAIAVTSSLVAAADQEERAADKIATRLSSAAPRIAIAYLPGARQRLKVGGRVLADGAILEPDGEITIEIEAVGSITLMPGATEDRDELIADRDAHLSQLSAVLREMDAGSLDQARVALDRRRALELTLERARSELAALAPDGLAELAAKIDALGPLEDETSDAAVATQADPGVARAKLAAIVDAIAQATTFRDAAQSRLAAVREQLAGLKGEVLVLMRQREQTLEQLPPPDSRQVRRLDLEAAIAARAASVNALLRDRRAFLETTPNSERLAALQATFDEAQAAQDLAQQQLIRLDRDYAVLERDLERDRQDGIEQRQRECEAELQIAEARVSWFEREVAALTLLDQLLQHSETKARAQFQAPVVARVQSYLETLFPDARISFDERLGVTGLSRARNSGNGRGVAQPGIEPLAGLSDGTREQIAVLVRLGLGRLLAETGSPVPVILDDALVYSDDARIGKLSVFSSRRPRFTK